MKLLEIIKLKLDNKCTTRCKMDETGSPVDGYEWECLYENPPWACDYCICNYGGTIDPRTGKELPALKRWWKVRRDNDFMSKLYESKSNVMLSDTGIAIRAINKKR